jgi:hypothetical protein
MVMAWRILLVAEPESGQISLYLQQPDGSLASPEEIFDGWPASANWRRRIGTATVRWKSSCSVGDERQVGVTHLDEKQRMPFPTLIPMEGKPLVIGGGAAAVRAGGRLWQ